MSGVKGRSGRKTMLKERTIEEICEMSSDILLKWLSNPEVDLHKKVMVAKDVVLKRLPTMLEHSGDIGINLKSLVDNAEQYSNNERFLPSEGEVAEVSDN